MRSGSLSGGGGAERRFARAAQEARRQGHDVVLVVNRELADDLNRAHIVAGGDPTLCVPSSYVSAIGFNEWLVRTVGYLEPDIIHLPLIQRSLVPFYAWLGVRPRQRVVQSIAWASLMDHQGAVDQRLLAHYLVQRATLVDVLYPRFLQSTWADKCGERIRISPCSFTDYDLFRPAPCKENIILYAGRLMPAKNPLLLLASVEQLLLEDEQCLSDWRVEIMGDGPLRTSVQEIASSQSFKGKVTVGSSPSLVEAMRGASVFVSLQARENYPSQSLLEAMACEAAVIATNVGDTGLLVTDDTGVMIPPTKGALAEAIRRLVGNSDLRRALGTKARQRVVSEHTIERFTQYLASLWREAAGTS